MVDVGVWCLIYYSVFAVGLGYLFYCLQWFVTLMVCFVLLRCLSCVFILCECIG